MPFNLNYVAHQQQNPSLPPASCLNHLKHMYTHTCPNTQHRTTHTHNILSYRRAINSCGDGCCMPMCVLPSDLLLNVQGSDALSRWGRSLHRSSPAKWLISQHTRRPLPICLLSKQWVLLTDFHKV